MKPLPIVERHRRELKAAIASALRRHGNVRDAAAELGMPRSTFHDRAKEFGIDCARKVEPQRRRA